jgi:hypothetical protein
MSRIIHQLRHPAKRGLSGFMSFLMLLSAVAVALPLLSLPALIPVKADAADYLGRTSGN